MNSKEIIVKLLSEIVSEIDKFDIKELEKLSSGEYQLSLKLVKKKVVKSDVQLSNSDFEKLHSELLLCKDRETGFSLLIGRLKNKKQLEFFAKSIDVYVMKQDKVDRIRERIIEGVIGATLRSSAIQDT